MQLSFLFLCFLAPPLSIHASVELEESGGGIVQPGQNLRLTCTVKGDSVKNNWWEWVRQAPGKGLEWVGQIDWGNNQWRTYYAPSLQSRTTLTADASTNQYYLELRSLAAADTATYYCARSSLGSGWSYFEYWGKGTQVTVTSATPTAPSVFPLVASNNLAPASTVDLACLVSGYFPEPVAVQWNSGAVTTGIIDFPAVLFSSNSLYSSSSQLTIPADQWESDPFQCNIEHTATHTRINKDFKGGPAKDPVAPEVQLLHSSCDSRSGDANIELVCLIQGFYPADVKVEWLVGGKSGLLPSHTDPPKRDATGNTFSTTSRANVSQADWLAGNAYHCQVTHAATQTVVKSTAKRCEATSGCQSSGISTYIRQPTPKDLYVNRTPKMQCVVINLVSEEGLSIKWSREKQGSINPQPLDVEEELNGTYTAISTLPVTVEEWSGGEKFTCTVEHPSFSAPITMTTSKNTEPSRAPKIFLFPPHPEELAAPRKQSAAEAKVHLICHVNDFIPRDISVQWLMNDNAVPEDQYVNTPAMKSNQGGTYNMYSGLEIDHAAWEAGNIYTCMVVHEGFEEKISQRTVQKSSGKK